MWMLACVVAVTLSAAPVPATSPPTAPKVPADAGLATRVSGNVTWQAQGRGATARLVTLGKLRAGDELAVPAGAAVSIVYFADGREERWEGPARVRVATQGGAASSGGAPVVSKTDATTARALSRVTLLVGAAGTARVGAATLRGHGQMPTLTPGEQQALTEARAEHARRRASAPADDLADDLAYVVLLRDLDQWAEMQTVLADARARVPGNETLDALAAWVARELPSH